MRYWIHASGDWDTLPEEWQEDLKEDIQEAFTHYGGAEVTVALRVEE